MSHDADVLVIGAGLSGLVAARALRSDGVEVTLVDKGVGPGGRLATRTVQDAVFDHGAQFFTIRGDDFAGLVSQWRQLGANVHVWSHGFARAGDIREGTGGVTRTGGDGHPRYAVEGGINTLGRVLADDLVVRTRARARAAWVAGGRWHVAVDRPRGPETLRARALLSTAPLPGALDVFAMGATPLPGGLAERLGAVAYDPCVALMVALDRPPALPDPGGVQFARGPVRWLADNARKDVSPTPAITVHGAAGWSAHASDVDDAGVVTTLLSWLRPWLGDARPTAVEVKRWRYSQPRTTIAAESADATVGGAPVVFAGDAFAQAKVEGAATSGLAAAETLRAVL